MRRKFKAYRLKGDGLVSTSVDTMKNFFNILKLYANDMTADGVAVLDHAIRTTTRFAGLQDAVNHFVSDMANVTATQGTAQSLLQNCGIVIGADYDFTVDTGAVSGWNAGMGVVKNAQDIVPEVGTLDNVPLPAAGSTTVHSYTGGEAIISGVASGSQINTAAGIEINAAVPSGNDIIVYP